MQKTFEESLIDFIDNQTIKRETKIEILSKWKEEFRHHYSDTHMTAEEIEEYIKYIEKANAALMGLAMN